LENPRFIWKRITGPGLASPKVRWEKSSAHMRQALKQTTTLPTAIAATAAPGIAPPPCAPDKTPYPLPNHIDEAKSPFCSLLPSSLPLRHLTDELRRSMLVTVGSLVLVSSPPPRPQNGCAASLCTSPTRCPTPLCGRSLNSSPPPPCHGSSSAPHSTVLQFGPPAHRCPRHFVWAGQRVAQVNSFPWQLSIRIV
jgi:hypothetical protein